MSAAGLPAFPSRISGAAWTTVYAAVSVAILPVSAPTTTLAIPKSARAGSPYDVSRTFAGLTSRCRIPASWAALRALHRRAPMEMTSATGRGPCAATLLAREPPEQYSMASHGRLPRVVPASYTVTMFGCEETRPVARHSVRKRRS